MSKTPKVVDLADYRSRNCQRRMRPTYNRTIVRVATLAAAFLFGAGLGAGSDTVLTFACFSAAVAVYWA